MAGNREKDPFPGDYTITISGLALRGGINGLMKARIVMIAEEDLFAHPHHLSDQNTNTACYIKIIQHLI